MFFMNADTAVATATAPTKAPAKKRAAKKPVKSAKKKAAKKSAKKKAAKKSEKPEGFYGAGGGIHAKDVRWTEKKVAFYKAIKKLPNASGTSEQIAAKSNEVLNSHYARHFGYHGVAGGLVKMDQEEGTRGFVFTLTAKGKNTDPVAELKKQNAGKDAK